ncbi:GNAT family N-acetyltransferase [Bacillus litorisediminis]|uniref:GNAT family N-acetyltransferase n=1 Tax=Bacillus litorisediminis TaxID=2922713 RepID=UPI001FAF2275|nr:GNAT family protein [Bacillus litorisediminis]
MDSTKTSIFKPFPILETERLLLRPITLADKEAIFDYSSRPEAAQYVTWEAHKSLSDTQTFLDFVLNQYESGGVAPWGMVIKATNQLIGTIDFVSWNKSHQYGEIGYVCSPDYWGNGYTPEAGQALLRFGFEKMGLVRIQARTFAENQASQRVLKKLGMTYEGTMRKAMKVKGNHWDITMYSILNKEYKSAKK